MSQIIINNTIDPIVPKIKLEEYEILGENNPLIKGKVDTFYFTNIQVDPHQISRNLINTMVKNQLYCLTAKNVGLDYNCFVFGIDNFITCFNPEIIHYSENESIMSEGDPNYFGLSLYIKRSDSITLKYQDVNGFEQIETYAGLTSRLIQSCVDKLAGLTFIDRCKPIALKLGMKARKKHFNKIAYLNVKNVNM